MNNPLYSDETIQPVEVKTHINVMYVYGAIRHNITIALADWEAFAVYCGDGSVVRPDDVAGFCDWYLNHRGNR